MIDVQEEHATGHEYASVSMQTGGLDQVLGDGMSFVFNHPELVVSFVLWQLALLYTIPTLFWDFELFVYYYRRWQRRRRDDPDIEWGLDAVQIRVLTIGNESVVQRTVDLLPEAAEDVVVIAEEPIQVTGATVVTVPAEFTCNATHKGRAVEWARRHHPTEKEYVLYLDEDTDASELAGIPSNADIVQFRERPSRSGGFLPYLAEIHRIGYNIEQRAFPFFQLPFYAWGGGIAIRRSLEEAVTWDTQTIVEDSVFAWRAVLEFDATLDVVPVYFSNQAPPSIWSMIMQRRRWLTGTRQRQEMLPFQYRLAYGLRDLGWALSTFGPVMWVVSVFSYAGYVDIALLPVFLSDAYLVLTVALLGHVYFWSVFGLLVYRPPLGVWAVLVLFTPIIVTIHSLGAIYGLVRPAKTFVVTRKVTDLVGGADDSQADETTDVPDASAAWDGEELAWVPASVSGVPSGEERLSDERISTGEGVPSDERTTTGEDASTEREHPAAEPEREGAEQSFAYLGYGAVAVGFGGVLASMALEPGFSLFSGTLSVLGYRGAATAPLFNGGLIVGGALGAGFVAYLWASASQPFHRAAVPFLLLATVAMSLVGVFPLPTAPHLPVSVAFLALLTVGVLVWGVGDYLAGRAGRAGAMLILPVVHVVTWGWWFVFPWFPPGIVIPQLVGVLVFVVWALWVSADVHGLVGTLAPTGKRVPADESGKRATTVKTDEPVVADPRTADSTETRP